MLFDKNILLNSISKTENNIEMLTLLFLPIDIVRKIIIEMTVI